MQTTHLLVTIKRKKKRKENQKLTFTNKKQMDTIHLRIRFSESTIKDILQLANDEQLKETQEHFKGHPIEEICKQVRKERDAKRGKLKL